MFRRGGRGPGGRHHRFLAELALGVPVPGPLAGDSAPLRADAEAADLCSDRRHRGGADSQPARADRRERNWDYRYVWVRDAAFCVYALLRLGFTSEADAFVRFILRHATAGEGSASGPIQVMYGIDGRTDLPERELPHLAGYRDSRPARAGNAAAQQLQLDIYGELMDSVYLYDDWFQPISSAQWDAITIRAEWLPHHLVRHAGHWLTLRSGQQAEMR
jgi:hypothetical protein